MQGPTPTLLDLIMAGGALGFCNLALLLAGIPVCLVVLAIARRRKTAIIVPAVFSGLAFLIGATAAIWGYSIVRGAVANAEAAGQVVSQAEINESMSLIWFTIGQHTVICLGFLCMVGLAVFLKRDREPADGAGPAGPVRSAP